MKLSRFSLFLGGGLLYLASHGAVLADIADPGDNTPNGSDVTVLNNPSFTTQSVVGRTIAGGDPIDWYSVNLQANSVYLFDTTSPTSFTDTVMAIYESLDDALASNAAAIDDQSGSANNASILFEATTTGTHYIAITPFFGTFDLIQTYNLNYTLVSGSSGGGGGGGGGNNGERASGSHIGITGTPTIVTNLPVVVINSAERNGTLAMVVGEATKAPGTSDGTEESGSSSDRTDQSTDDRTEESAAEEDIPELTSVEFRFRNAGNTWSEWQPVNGMESWWATFDFDPDMGTHLIQVRAADASGEQSIPKMTMLRVQE